MKQAANLLADAWKLINRKSKWTKGAPYRDVNGNGCNRHQAAACCSWGALQKVGEDYAEDAREAAEDFLDTACAEVSGYRNYIEFNDRYNTNYTDVRRMWKRAIASAKEATS